MELTSKAASKMVKKLEADLSSLKDKDSMSSTFKASVGEDVESCRPAYNFNESHKQMEVIQMQILKLKHAINKFNVETKLEGFDMTIDQALTYMPMLRSRSMKLKNMKDALPKKRVESYNTQIVDYTYINYDVNDVEKAYETVTDTLSKLQLALDDANLKETFTVEL